MKLVRTVLCAVALSVSAGVGHAQSLTPFQQDALDKILASMDPEIRPMMRAQLARTLAALNEQQVSMMLAALTESMVDTEAAEDEESYASESASPEDLEYNCAQYEPVMRRVWQASRAFDDFVTRNLAEHCPSEEFAVFGRQEIERRLDRDVRRCVPRHIRSRAVIVVFSQAPHAPFVAARE